jgi:hypothetical protein
MLKFFLNATSKNHLEKLFKTIDSWEKPRSFKLEFWGVGYRDEYYFNDFADNYKSWKGLGDKIW